MVLKSHNTKYERVKYLRGYEGMVMLVITFNAALFITETVT